MTPRVYLAGPDVFHPEHERIFAERREICRQHGLEPLVPLDNKATTAAEIYHANIRLLDRCHGVIANITPFRGPHCDVGTAWEIGYAVARECPVFGFSEDARLLLQRVPGAGSPKRDSSEMLVEDFQLSENLMIAVSLVEQTVHRTFENAARAAARHLRAGRSA